MPNKSEIIIHKDFKKFVDAKNLMLNLGCGKDIKKDFLNIDNKLRKEKLNKIAQKRSGEALDVILHDLTSLIPIPLPENSCKFIYSSDFLEHIYNKQALDLLFNCYKVLKCGGSIRLCLPDMKKCCKAYINGDFSFFTDVSQIKFSNYIETSKTIIDYMNLLVYGSEHKYCYDVEKIVKMLETTGFRKIRESSLHPIDSCGLYRRRFSFYIIAEK